jgi:hypothetical protein
MRKTGGCRKNCIECDLYQICGGCERRDDCLVNLCISKRLRIKGITLDCKKCAYASVCAKSGSYSPLKPKLRELNSILESRSITSPTIELPRFIPEIPVDEPLKLRWKKLKIEAVIVTFRELGSEVLETIRRDGIHDILGFEGTILLSTIMPDEYLTEETFNTTIGLIKEGGFDGVVGWDMPVYIDSPKVTSLTNLVSATIYTARYVKEGIPTIPLLKGSDAGEMKMHARWLKCLGFDRVAIHATEYVLEQGELRERAQDLYATALGEVLKKGFKPLVIGVMSPSSFPPLLYGECSDASFAGMSWLLRAEEYMVYDYDKTLDLKNQIMVCNCEACRGKSPTWVSRSVDDLAEHNLIQFRNFVERRRSEIKMYDVVLEKDTMAVVGDLHIGTPQSLWHECLSKLEEVKPSYIVFLGDTFDFENGKPTKWETVTFFRGLRKIGAEVIPVLGCSDSSRRRLFEVLEKQAFRTYSLRPQLLEASPFTAETVLDLIRFYGIAKEKVTVKLVNERKAILEHGDGLGFKRGSNLKKIAEALMDRKGPDDIYIIAHYHKSHIDPERRIAVLGSWQTVTQGDKESGFVPDIMNILLIKEDGSLRLEKA